MSPDQYEVNSKLNQIHQSFVALMGAYPALGKFLNNRSGDFVGLSIWQTETDEWKICLRALDAEGTPSIMFASGDDVGELLYSADKRIRADEFFPDKKRMKELGITPK